MSIQQQLSQSASLLSAVDAVRNWRAAALMLASLVLAALIFGLGGVVGLQVHAIFGAVFFLLGFAVAFYGANAVGIMLMDEARGATSRSILAAILTSLATGHRLILVMLLVGITYIVGVLILASLLFICKMPGLGPLLFAFVFPAGVVVSGIAVFALYAVITPLAAPSIWSGATTMEGVSRLAAIARQRIVVVILSMMVLLFIVVIVGAILSGIMLTGTLIAGSLSAAILNVGGMNPANLMGMFGMSGFGGGSDSGYVAAGAFGGGIVWALALTLPALVYFRGCCQVYLANIQGVNVEDMEQHVRGTFDAAKRKAEEIKAKGEAMAAQQAHRFETLKASAPVAAVAQSFSQQCPVCSTPYVSGDVFCGGCGHKLT
jgi:hypothetical protein